MANETFTRLDDRTIFVNHTPELKALPDRPEPVRLDPAKDEIELSDVLQQSGWSVDQLETAIGKFGHPKPRRFTSGRIVYSRALIADWRENLKAELRTFGFQVK